MSSITPSPEPDGRRRRSLRTRGLLLDAAARLFLERGYVATTIEAIAAEAGVAVQTVYYVFGTKPRILAEVLDAAIAGDADPVPVVDRPWFDGLETARDPVLAVHQLTTAATVILCRTAPILEVVRRAASDPEVGALLEDNRRNRRADQRRLVEVLARNRILRPDLDVDGAADILYALVNEELFLLLTADCGWAVERYRSWVTGLLLEQLAGCGLTPPATQR